MGRKNQNRKSSGSVVVLTLMICLLLILDAVMLFLINREEAVGHGSAVLPPVQLAGTVQTTGLEQNGETEHTTVHTTHELALQFPCVSEDRLLSYDSLFQYTGVNPDFGMEFGEDIAGIQVSNLSERFLLEATIQAVMRDGTTCSFVIRDLPAGMSATAFSAENEILQDTESCMGVICQASFVDGDQLMIDLLRISTEGTAITVENISNEPLSDLIIYCHCSMGADIFGGATYQYPIEFLAAQESVIVDAVDCFLGDAAVVRVAMNE